MVRVLRKRWPKKNEMGLPCKYKIWQLCRSFSSFHHAWTSLPTAISLRSLFIFETARRLTLPSFHCNRAFDGSLVCWRQDILILVLIQRVEDKMNLGRYVSVLLYLKMCALSTTCINDVSSQSSKWCDPTTPDSASRQILHAKNSHPNIHSFSVPHVNDNDLVYVFILMSSRYIRVSKLEVKVIKLSQIRWCQF